VIVLKLPQQHAALPFFWACRVGVCKKKIQRWAGRSCANFIVHAIDSTRYFIAVTALRSNRFYATTQSPLEIFLTPRLFSILRQNPLPQTSQALVSIRAGGCKKMEKRDIFRKVSLDRLSSPEQLDMLATVTAPSGRLVLLALGLLIVLALIWFWFGNEIPGMCGHG
jgi:hypothetical protein